MDVFRQWLENDDPVAAYRALRAQAGWGDREEVGTYKPGSENAPQPKHNSSLSPEIVNIIQSGFASGGIVPDNIVRLLQLKGKNTSFVSDDMLNIRRNAYPFYKEKRAGVPTGRIVYVKDFPLHIFIKELG